MKRFRGPATRPLGGFLVFSLLSLFPVFAAAQEAAKPAKVVTIEGITEYKLDNGLKVLLYPDPSASRVTVNMTILVGSRHEGYGETGMAHLLEHMLFKGSPKFQDCPKALRDHGASFNGTTWTDRTNYFETMPASEKNLEFAIQLEADRLLNCFIRREDLASEMTVVRNEFEQGENSPEYVLLQRMMATAFEWHNYGKSTIGNRTDIERVPIDNLQAFYKKYYRPDNTVLIVAGKFDEAKALGFVAKYFGPMKKPADKVRNTYTEEPAQDGEREVVLRRVGKVGAVGAAYHIPSGSHEDFPACEVLANVLDYEPNGRLYKSLVATKKATSLSSFAFCWHDPGLLLVQASIDSKKEDGLRAFRSEMLADVAKVSADEFTKEEVERVKLKLLKERELQMNDPNRIGVALSEWVAVGDWRLFFLHRDRLEKVSPADVSRVAKKYLQPANSTTGIFVPTEQPTRSPIPETPVVADLVKDYKGRTAVAAGETFDPTPENIEKRVQRVDLPSGVKAAFLSKKTRGEAVNLRLALRFGNEDSLKGQTDALEFLGDLMRRGTKDLTYQQLDDALDKLKARVTVSSGTGQLSVGVQCKRDNVAAVLNLVGKILREPRFPEDQFDVLKRQKLEELEKSLTEPTSLAQVAFRRKLVPVGKDDIRYTPTIEEEIERVKAVTLAQVKKIYAEQLGGTVGELAVVGEFDVAETTKIVSDFLKDWKSNVPYKRVADKAFPDVKGETIDINTPDKENAMYVAGLTFVFQDTDPDYEAVEVANFLLGDPALSSRLGNRVREKDGLSYGVGSQFRASPQDPFAIFVIFAITNPKNIDKAQKAIAEEVEKFLKDGADDKEVAEGVKAYLERKKNSRGTDAGIAGQLLNGLHLGRTYAFDAEREKRIGVLTPEKLNGAMKKLIDPKRLVIIRAGDFSKKDATPPKKGE